MALFIDEDECLSCGDCVDECPTNSISETMVAFKINPESCNECEGENDEPQCKTICPSSGCIQKLV